MTKLWSDSILLFILVIPFIMAVRIGPGETPFWLFGIIFSLLLGYIIVDLIVLKEKVRFLIKQIVLWLVIVSVIGSAFVSAIIVRHQTAPIYMVHDIILQQEAAIRYLVKGKNPYAETYFATPLEQWNYSPTEKNPALYHFVMQPLYVIFALPFYYISNHTIGYFDGRIPLLFLFLSTLIVGRFLIKDVKNRLLFLILMAFNPAMLSYTLEGRSDMFMFGFLIAGLYFLHQKKYLFSAIGIGFAFAVKQSVWPLLPLYIAFLYFKTKSIKRMLKSISVFFVSFAIFAGPFFFWNQKAFLESTVFYLSGNTPNSYPISGYGLGMLLHSSGLIKDVHAYFPFVIWQLVFVVPVVIVLTVYLRRSPTVKRLIISYAICLFVFWYLSRYFNNSHLGYLSVLFITGYFFPEDNKKEIDKQRY